MSKHYWWEIGPSAVTSTTEDETMTQQPKTDASEIERLRNAIFNVEEMHEVNDMPAWSSLRCVLAAAKRDLDRQQKEKKP